MRDKSEIITICQNGCVTVLEKQCTINLHLKILLHVIYVTGEVNNINTSWTGLQLDFNKFLTGVSLRATTHTQVSDQVLF